jgi:hypothetical protein
VLCQFVVSWITLFTSVTSTSLIGGRKHLLEQCEISTNEVVMLFDPLKLVYEVKSLSRTNADGEVLGGRIF